MKQGDKKIWITSWPNGKAKTVELIAPNTNMGKKYWYIRKPEGGTDTTSTDFLFDLPEGFNP